MLTRVKNTYLKLYNNPTPYKYVGFFYGCINSLHEHDIMEQPLSSIFNSAFVGLLYSVGTLMVTSFLPPHIKPVVPVILLASTIKTLYYKQ